MFIKETGINSGFEDWLLPRDTTEKHFGVVIEKPILLIADAVDELIDKSTKLAVKNREMFQAAQCFLG